MIEPTRVWATVAYDGAPFHGFTESSGVRTVAGDLRQAIEQVVQHRVEIVCAGRTDRGVHGWGQVISFDVEADRLDPGPLAHSLNRLCRPEIVVRQLGVAPKPNFDARFDATSRLYRYRLSTAQFLNPVDRFTHWHVGVPLDVEAMRDAAKHLHGGHDFSSFCRRPDPLPDGEPRSLQRTILATALEETDGLVVFQVEASAFCQQMVRAITGTLVDVGRGRRNIDDIPAIIAACDRAAAGGIAPPQGLTLWRVSYPKFDA